ncbi:MAG: hypothetical protein GWP15_01590, partial [Nitrospirae bacterium]|nr:hypothetical protein [Nitrospirota bacterium]
GKPTPLPWGVNFESAQIKYTIPIHPTQIYAFLYTLAIAITLILISKKKAGFIGLIGIASFSFVNFLEHFLRGDDTLLLFGIRVPQIIMLLLSITSGIFLYIHYNKPTNTNKIKKS